MLSNVNNATQCCILRMTVLKKKEKIRESASIVQLNRQKKLEKETGRIEVPIRVIANNVKEC